MYKNQQSYSLSGQARVGFVKKVYSIISLQLLVTIGAVLLNIVSPTFAMIQAKYTSLFWICFISTLGSMLALFFSPQLAKKSPVNMGLLGVFTLGESYLVSCVCSMYTPESVLLAGIATLGATLGITFYAMTTDKDFTSANSVTAFAYGVFSTVFFVSLINIFFIKSSVIQMGIAIVVGVAYSIYLLVDTQMILGGKHKSLSLDNYVLGAIILYVDIVGLFLKILQILGKKKDD